MKGLGGSNFGENTQERGVVRSTTTGIIRSMAGGGRLLKIHADRARHTGYRTDRRSPKAAGR